MATAKPKVKRMMVGGMAAGAARGMGAKLSSAGTRAQMQAAARSQPLKSGLTGIGPSKTAAANLADRAKALSQMSQKVGTMATQSAPNKMRGVIGPLAAAGARGMMKKGGAVKKATKK